MRLLELDPATVVSRGVHAGEESAIEDFIDRAFTHFHYQIDLETVEVTEAWMPFPGIERSLATDFLSAIGDELDMHSEIGNRRAWYNTLSNYAESI